jgi:hypothetical protein
VVSLQLLKTLLLVMFPPVVASLLLLVSPAFPVVSCVAVGPFVDVFLQMLIVPDVPAMAKVAAVAAFPIAVEVSSATGVFNVHSSPCCCWPTCRCWLPCRCCFPAVVGFQLLLVY